MNEPSFLQSADWARFQAAVGHPAIELDGIRFFSNSLPLDGTYLYCPHPDVVDSAEFLDRAVRLAKDQRSWFVRVEPNVGSVRIWNLESGIWKGKTRIQDSGFRIHPTLAIQPGRTWHVPLGSDEQMLAAIHEKTRYNIRLAEKRGVAVRFSSDPTDVDILTTLLEKTGDRTGIRLHPASYYRTMMEVLGAKSQSMTNDQLLMTNSADRLSVELAIADHPTSPDGLRGAGASKPFDHAQGKPIAVALIAHFGDRAIYLHGGSDYEQRQLMAPHLLHWRVMQRARAAGQTIYDMGGVAPEEPEPANSKQQTASGSTAPADSRLPLAASSSPHPWAGISRFKRGFGGAAVDYPPAVDVVVNRAMYGIYQLGRKLRRSF